MSSLLFGAVNHVATSVQPCCPWTFTPNIPESALTSKAAFTEWSCQPSTEHLFVTATEGLAPNIRCGKQNPVYRLHGLIADFEPSKITEGMIVTLLDRCPADFKPGWISRTFSGGVRLVWQFEEPIAMDQPKIAAAFLKLAFRELRVEDLFPCIDRHAWDDLYKLYDVGRDWKQVSEQRISTKILHYWMMRAWEKTNTKNLDGVEIPLDKIANEVEKRFPGRWEGPFEWQARGGFLQPGFDQPHGSPGYGKGNAVLLHGEGFLRMAGDFRAAIRRAIPS